MDQGARLWLAKAVRRHYWRVSRWYDLDDLMQEGYYAYYYTVRHYPQVSHPPHLMALFKLVFNSVICNLANQRSRRVDDVCESDLAGTRAEDGGLLSSMLAERAADPDIAEALVVLATAPQYVKDAVALMMSGDERLRRKSRGARGRRETMNERLCRLVGYDPAQADIVGEIRTHLRGS